MKKTLIALTLAWSSALSAQGVVDRVDAASARCEAAREEKLAPIRAQKVARCRRSGHPPTAGCETYYSTYGNNSNHANGSIVAGRFYDLPECVAARRSERRLDKQNF